MYVLIDNNNIVQNIIIYDGISSYTPPTGLTLESTANVYNIGDTFTS